jgi:hypothetical protein
VSRHARLSSSVANIVGLKQNPECLYNLIILGSFVLKALKVHRPLHDMYSFGLVRKEAT